jgi:predicted AAA+ superfamily ATPase
VKEVGSERLSDPVFQPDHYRPDALRWALARGVRNGRSADHFARHWVGKNFLV